MSKVYVGNISLTSTEESIKEFFISYGISNFIDIEIMRDKDTGRSKGFAFVIFSNEDEANNAINVLNYAKLEGRMIICKLYK